MPDSISPDSTAKDRRDKSQLIERALARDPSAVLELVTTLTPTVRTRIERVVRRCARGRDVRCAVEDVIQNVWLALFANQGKVLRSWDPARGLSLAGFVGLVASRQALDVMRSGRLSPYKEEPTDCELLERHAPTAPPIEDEVASRQLFQEIAQRLRSGLTPYGMHMFELLFIDCKTVEQVSEELSMCSDAVYVWRSRLTQRARELAREILSETPSTSRRQRSKHLHGR